MINLSGLRSILEDYFSFQSATEGVTHRIFLAMNVQTIPEAKHFLETIRAGYITRYEAEMKRRKNLN